MTTKFCNTCALAEWKRTAAGRLHPDGSGKCMWAGPVVAPYWAAKEADYISRRATHQWISRDPGPYAVPCPTHTPSA